MANVEDPGELDCGKEGLCTNPAVGGFGPHHIPSGLDPHGSLPFSFLLTASDCNSPTVLEDVFPDFTDGGCDSELVIRHAQTISTQSAHCCVDRAPLVGQVGGHEVNIEAGLEVGVDKHTATGGDFDGVCRMDSTEQFVHCEYFPMDYKDPSCFPPQVETDSAVFHRPCDGLCAGEHTLEGGFPTQVENDSAVFHRPCDGLCAGEHILEGLSIQLNPCSFYAECFCHPSGANFLFNGVNQGFEIVDPDFQGSYFCSNYQSILDPEFKSQMDSTIESELDEGKVSIVKNRPQCIHALGAIHKSGNIKVLCGTGKVGTCTSRIIVFALVYAVPHIFSLV